MTKFARDSFDFFGGYLTYGPERRFVARFKYNRRDKAGFISFLIKNFTVEEYFGMYGDGLNMSPVAILETKGYVSTTVKSSLKFLGLPQTQEGFKQLIKLQVAAHEARRAVA